MFFKTGCIHYRRARHHASSTPRPWQASEPLDPMPSRLRECTPRGALRPRDAPRATNAVPGPPDCAAAGHFRARRALPRPTQAQCSHTRPSRPAVAAASTAAPRRGTPRGARCPPARAARPLQPPARAAAAGARARRRGAAPRAAPSPRPPPRPPPRPARRRRRPSATTRTTSRSSTSPRRARASAGRGWRCSAGRRAARGARPSRPRTTRSARQTRWAALGWGAAARG